MIVSGLNNSCWGTNVSGHSHVVTVVWAQSCMASMGTAVVEPLTVALDGGTRPRATTPSHPHFLSSIRDGQANVFRWRDTSPRAALSVVLCITYNSDPIIYNYYYKFHN